jgi:hypothetical protein
MGFVKSEQAKRLVLEMKVVVVMMMMTTTTLGFKNISAFPGSFYGPIRP